MDIGYEQEVQLANVGLGPELIKKKKKLNLYYDGK
jgi:hypothetical protein